MDIQKVASTGTAVAVLGGGTFMGGNYALDQATGGPEKRIKAKQSELQLIVREVGLGCWCCDSIISNCVWHLFKCTYSSYLCRGRT